MMVDESKTFFITDHVHFDPMGNFVICADVRKRANPIFARGFKTADIFLKMQPDGNLDYSDALHLFWKDEEGTEQHG